MAEYLVSDAAIQDAHPHTQYDLIANICHEGEPGKGNSTSCEVWHCSCQSVASYHFII